MSEVQEAKQFGAWLLAASKSIGKHCDAVNDKFIICKSESNNPAHCVDIGKQVTACALNVFSKIDVTCKKEFDAYGQCLNQGNLEFTSCRAPNSKTEENFFACLAKHNL